MEFWGVEVKNGESLKVEPGEDYLVHLSLACLGEVNKDKGSEPVCLYVKFGDQKLVLGTLSSEKCPHISYDLVFEKEFELSHNWKNGSVFFTGYKVEKDQFGDEDFDDSDEDIPVSGANGKPELEVKHSVKSDANEAKQKGKIGDPRKEEKANEKAAHGEDEEDSSESESDDSDEDSSEDEPMENGGVESSEGEDDSDEDEDDDDESDDEETPKKEQIALKVPLSVEEALQC